MAVPESVKRYSLSDNPVPQLPRLQVETSSPTQPETVKEENEADNTQEVIVPTSSIPLTPNGADHEVPPTPADTVIPEASLGDLKRSQQLERRASKRYSMYTFAKLTNSTSGPDRNNRKSMLAPGSLLTPGDLDAVAEEEDPNAPPSTLGSSTSMRARTALRDKAYGDLTKKPSGSDLMSAIRMRQSPSTSPVPPLPPTLAPITAAASREPSPARSASTIAGGDVPPPPPPANSKPGAATIEASTSASTTKAMSPSTALQATPEALTVFLQVGRQVQKVTLDPENLSSSSLRMLFVDKFSYNPGASNFPDIYIKDPSSGVQYLLEDVDEVQPHSLLSLNIERK